MRDIQHKILFVSIHNSARSQMAEALLDVTRLFIYKKYIQWKPQIK
jgi:hypothetical protein